jgi:hypothetical protein
VFRFGSSSQQRLDERVVILSFRNESCWVKVQIRGEGEMTAEADIERRGLMKLMLKMPALRGKLQLLSAANAELLGLCGAFEEASSTLDRLRKENVPMSSATINEYETLCEEIEAEILEICIR